MSTLERIQELLQEHGINNKRLSNDLLELFEDMSDEINNKEG